MYCSQCGAAIPVNSKFCPSCGAQVAAATAPPPIQAPPVAQAPPILTAPPAKRSPLVTIVIVIAVLFAGFIVLSIIAAIAVPGLLRARVSGNESVAIQRLAAIQVAQTAFAAGCGNGGYATSLVDLAGGVPGTTEQIAELARLDREPKSGFRFVVRPRGTVGAPDCHGRPTSTVWYASAEPVTFGTTGTRSFAIDASGTIWQVTQAAAPVEPFGPPAVIVR